MTFNIRYIKNNTLEPERTNSVTEEGNLRVLTKKQSCLGLLQFGMSYERIPSNFFSNRVPITNVLMITMTNYSIILWMEILNLVVSR